MLNFYFVMGYIPVPQILWLESLQTSNIIVNVIVRWFARYGRRVTYYSRPKYEDTKYITVCLSIMEELIKNNKKTLEDLLTDMDLDCLTVETLNSTLRRALKETMGDGEIKWARIVCFLLLAGEIFEYYVRHDKREMAQQILYDVPDIFQVELQKWIRERVHFLEMSTLILHTNGFYAQGKYVPAEVFVTKARPPYPGTGFAVDLSSLRFTTEDVRANLWLQDRFGMAFPPPQSTDEELVPPEDIEKRLRVAVRHLGGGTLYTKGQASVLRPYVKTLEIHDLQPHFPRIEDLPSVPYAMPRGHGTLHASGHHCSGRIGKMIARYHFEN